MSTEIRERIAAEVRSRGLAPVARELGVGRAGLAGYLVGGSRHATEFLVEQRAVERLPLNPER